MKKTICILTAIVAMLIAALGFVGCEEENPYPYRQHAAMVICDQLGQEWCELTEEENHKTITIPYGLVRSFSAEAKFPDGNQVTLQGKNAIGTSYDSYTPVGGETQYDYNRAWVDNVGTYELRFITNDDNTMMYPYYGYLTIIITINID